MSCLTGPSPQLSLFTFCLSSKAVLSTWMKCRQGGGPQGRCGPMSIGAWRTQLTLCPSVRSFWRGASTTRTSSRRIRFVFFCSPGTFRPHIKEVLYSVIQIWLNRLKLCWKGEGGAAGRTQWVTSRAAPFCKWSHWGERRGRNCYICILFYSL